MNMNAATNVEPLRASNSTDSSAKAMVVEALQQLVENGLAIWRRNSSDEVELQLVSGPVLALGKTGVTRV
jgi:hypothetical protein